VHPYACSVSAVSDPSWHWQCKWNGRTTEVTNPIEHVRTDCQSTAMTNRLLVVVGRLSFHGLQTHTRTYTLQIGCINCHQVQAAILYGKLCLVFEAKWTFQAHQW